MVMSVGELTLAVTVRKAPERVMSMGVMSMEGQLSLPLTNCSTPENRLCTLPGQHSRAGPDEQATGELSSRV